MATVGAWSFEAPGSPFAYVERDEIPAADEVLVEVAGCGVCHTDLGFVYEGVPTRHPLPLTLGHEISGRVVATGDSPAARRWQDLRVVVPAVIPCGECPACRAGRGSICPHQVFPGCDIHGGFASHVRVPARGLCPVPDDIPMPLADLAVVADAVTTPFQAIEKSGLQPSDLAVFVGAGGVGGFGVQIAAARGAHVVAIDVDEERLELLADHGAAVTLRADQLTGRELRAVVTDYARLHEIPTWRWRIFETSGTPAGQETAFGLLRHGSYLGIVGYTPGRVSLRLSNLMAFDARAEGNWGCVPEHYPAALDLVIRGTVKMAPFIERRSLEEINDTFAELHAGKLRRRVVLCPKP